MTVEEHLYYFARIKGIPKDRLKELVEEAIEELNLESHRTKEAG
jgi:ABC-type multidrug transport system ATPase subunit